MNVSEEQIKTVDVAEVIPAENHDMFIPIVRTFKNYWSPLGCCWSKGQAIEYIMHYGGDIEEAKILHHVEPFVYKEPPNRRYVVQHDVEINELRENGKPFKLTKGQVIELNDEWSGWYERSYPFLLLALVEDVGGEKNAT